MTNTELLAKIKAAIERLKRIGGIVPLDNREQKTGYESALIDIEIFLDTLEESEKPIIPKDLEEAAKEYEDALGYYECMSQWPSVAFIDGAKWQEEKDTRDMYMSGNRDFEKVYQLGRADMREQMMKDAVEGKVAGDGEHCWIDADVPMSWLYQDKVRLIIVKED